MRLDKKAQDLHTKYTEGTKLSSEDLAYLNNWYAKLDAEESIYLKVEKSEGSNKDLEKQIEVALEQLVELTQKLKLISAENDKLKKENNALKTKLAERFGPLRA